MYGAEVQGQDRSSVARKACTTRRAASAGRASVPPATPRSGFRPPWSKILPERIAAVRDLLQGSGNHWIADAVARSFERARTAPVEPVFDRLAAVGFLVRSEKNSEGMWKAAGKA